MAATLHTTASYLSPSPSASPSILPELNSSFKACNSTQPGTTQPGITPPHNFSDTIVDAWDEKYNQRTIPIISRRDLHDLIASVLCESGVSSNMEVESRLSLQLERRTLESEAEMHAAKVNAFSEQLPDEILELLSFVRSFTIEGQRQYVIRTLAMLCGEKAQGKASMTACEKRVNKKKTNTPVRRSKRIIDKRTKEGRRKGEGKRL